MTHRGHGKYLLLLAAAVLAAALTGCMGPTTRVLVRETQAHGPGYADASSREEVNAFYLWETIEFLSGQSREEGSLGAAMAVDYMKRLLTDYGYQTDETAGIVRAVRTSDTPEADIVIVASNYGAPAESPGAIDNGSGIAVFLETARLLAEIQTSDTELWFVAFPGEGSGGEAARQFVNTMAPEEKRRVLGVVQVGPMGSGDEDSLILGTEDGEATFLGDQLNQASIALTGNLLPYEVFVGGAPAVFRRGQLPAVYVGQGEPTIEQGTALDRLALVDVDQLVPAVNVLRRMLSNLMDESTPSMVARAHHDNDLRDGAYVQRREVPIPFGKDRRTLEEQTGQTGELYTQNTTNDGKSMEGYRYVMKWFDVDQQLYTDFYFVDGRLDMVSVEADPAGVDTEDMLERVSDIYGEPSEKNEGPYGFQYRWLDTRRRTQIVMIPNSDGYELEIREYDTPRTEIPEDDKRAAVLNELVWQILPEEEQESVTVSIYTDGIGKTDHDIAPVEAVPEDEAEHGQAGDMEDEGAREGTAEPVPSWVMSLDLEDAVREDGSFRNKGKTARLIVYMYGQILAERESAGYKEAYDALFSAEPEGWTDFAESFQWFVLARDWGSLPGRRGDQLRFFEGYEELAQYRGQVREALGLPAEKQVIVGEAPTG